MKDSFPSTPTLLLRCLCVCVRPTNRAEREVVLSNLDTLCSVALGEKVTEDFLLARDTVITICSITDHSRVRGRTLQLPSDLSDVCRIEWTITLFPNKVDSTRIRPHVTFVTMRFN